MDAFLFRSAREEDLERLVEIHTCAYPAAGGYERRKRGFTSNRFGGGLGDVRVIEQNGRVVSHALLYRLEIWLGGRRVPVGGIGSLAVAPEARRNRVAHLLLDALHAEIVEQYAPLSLLYPFRERFYADLGYANVTPLVTMRVASDAVAAAAALMTSATGDTAFSCAPLDGQRLVEARALYDEVGPLASGRVVRGEARWLSLFAQEDRYWIGVISSGGALEGYVGFSYDAPSMHARQTLVVHELTARSDAANLALLAALGRQRDQVDDIELTIPLGDPLAFAFRDAPGSRRGTPALEHPLGTVSAGPMVRVGDVRRALALRGYQRDGELTLRCTDDPQAGCLRLSVRGGAAEVGETNEKPNVELSRSTLASILAAGMLPSEAAQLGLLRAEVAALRAADDLFAGPRFQCLDPF